MLLHILRAAFCAALLALAVAASSLATRAVSNDAPPSLNPPVADLHPLPARRAPVVPIPRWLSDASDPSAQRPRFAAQQARRASPSDPPGTTSSGAIAVTDESGSFLGYVAPLLNIFGEYGEFTSDKSQALIVTVTTGGLRDMMQAQGVGGLPNIGGVVGFASTSDDLSVGSPNYAYIAGVSPTARFSPPVAGTNSFSTATGIPANFESSIWFYNPTTQAITARWINTDLSQIAVSITYANDFNQAFSLTGDADAFRAFFGRPYPTIFFHLEP